MPRVVGFKHLEKDPWLFFVTAAAIVNAAIVLWLTRRGSALPPDSADYAEAARSLVRGQGDTVNRIVFHAGVFRTIRHPLEVHGLLQPPLIAALFFFFGPNGGLVRVPSVLFAAGLLVSAFWAGRRMAGTLAGLVATILLFSRSELLSMSVLGSDDVGEALFAFTSLFCFTVAATERRSAWFVAAGVFAGLASLEKVTGLVLAPAFALLVLLGRKKAPGSLRHFLQVVAPTAVVFALYSYRNYRVYRHLGSPYGALAWFGKERFASYFAFYDPAPTMADVWSRLGFAKMVSLTVDQARHLAFGIAHDPLFLLGLISLVLIARAKTAFVVATAAYLVLLVLLVGIGHHVEHRYLSPLYPIGAAAIGAVVAAGIAWIRGRAPAATGRFIEPAAWVALAAAALVCARAEIVGSSRLGAVMQREGPCADAARFIRSSVDPSAVVLTSNPWFVSWETERAAVNPPTNGDPAVLEVVRRYHASWAMTGGRVVGALDLEEALRSPILNEGLRPARRFDGGACDVYRLTAVP